MACNVASQAKMAIAIVTAASLRRVDAVMTQLCREASQRPIAAQAGACVNAPVRPDRAYMGAVRPVAFLQIAIDAKMRLRVPPHGLT